MTARRAKDNYEFLVRSAVNQTHAHTTVLSIEPFETQGFSSTTYSVQLGDQTSIVVQVRPSDRPLLLSNLDTARSTFGSLVPSGSFLMSTDDGPNQQLLLYSMSRVPGRSFDSYMRFSGGHEADSMLSIARSLGTILAQALIPEAEVAGLISSQGGEKAQGLNLLDEQLQRAIQAQTDVKSFSDLKPLFASLLHSLRTDAELKHLPLTISNGDISPTNIIIQNDTVSGIVDWEYIDIRPLGYDTEAIFWLMYILDPPTNSFSLRPNSEEIEQSFWTAFSTTLPAHLRSQHTAIELALHIAFAIKACPAGYFNPLWATSLQEMSKYRIPLQYWAQA
ncbi:kinase-like domain-containing protein [Lentinula lateritia]|nr:kinase-like domain-containing protein [Lentinula lateritia]